MPSIETLNSRRFISGEVAATIFRWKIEFLETAEGFFLTLPNKIYLGVPQSPSKGFGDDSEVKHEKDLGSNYKNTNFALKFAILRILTILQILELC